MGFWQGKQIYSCINPLIILTELITKAVNNPSITNRCALQFTLMDCETETIGQADNNVLMLYV